MASSRKTVATMRGAKKLSPKSTEAVMPLIVVVGTTAAGKSDLAVALALRLSGELVSADSRQIYRDMDIGTAKLKPPQGVKQWMVDVVRPDQKYSLQEYQRDALRCIRDISTRGHIPILVGGTGLYVDSVVENWTIPKVEANEALRKTLEADLKRRNGLQALVRRLRLVDPVSARKIDKKNPRRVIRALEVALTTGESFVSQRKRGKPLFRVLKVGIRHPRHELARRLSLRTDWMIKRGLVAETKRLSKRYPARSISFSGIGYREASEFIKGDISRDEMARRIAQRSLQYAKRQETWWKRDKDITWVEDWHEALALAEEWLNK